MLSFQDKSTITITCHKFLSEALTKEVKALGFEVGHTFPTGVTLEGSLNDCIKLNMNLHCASQVLYSLKKFTANNADDVYEHTASIDWSGIMEDEDYFSITSNVLHPTINNNMFANLRVKDAIVDQIRQRSGKRPNTGAELSGIVIHLFWKNEDAELFLDTTGNSIGRHGYRKIPGRAPMLEALAAATVLSTNWNKNTPFLNPMCGSGTLAIEAVLIATNRKPGLFRTNYAFMHVKGYDEQVYHEEDNLLEAQIIDKPELKIIASDISHDAIINAQKNAIAAGVKDLITFEVGDFETTTVPKDEAGIVFMNPEYGDRLGELEELEHTYARIGDFFKKKCSGYTGYIFTGNMDLARKIGLKAQRRIPFYNSKIECRLFEFELYRGTKRVEANA
ncbi:RNA methyltransferase [Taibaiella sp. KBW10]|uniref:THUMP domain-containing class I SAM-dependent RNA methyltransferase n=1 Tax=Taibaiella sp. KBW10 TaxID=2153357 RepID=UPI000F59A748|nr:class I SAM-dependent RNA methyltransferase [Taibaiella sp. KBW10]RQO32211.1 RNA methyltransferase [Taibaiella sp. KBW10]